MGSEALPVRGTVVSMLHSEAGPAGSGQRALDLLHEGQASTCQSSATSGCFLSLSPGNWKAEVAAKQGSAIQVLSAQSGFASVIFFRESHLPWVWRKKSIEKSSEGQRGEMVI